MTNAISWRRMLVTAVFAAGSVAVAPLAAAESREAARGDTHWVGGETRKWLDLQISGDAADGPPQGMEGELAERVWRRYADSFSHPIPEKFERDRFQDRR